MVLKNLDKLTEYINYRNQAFESKLVDGVKNPLGNKHFCNNQKYLDAFSQDIIHSNTVLEQENASTEEILYNTLVHRVLLDKDFCKEHTDEHGIFRLKDYDQLAKETDNASKWSSRYRNMMQNRHLAKMKTSEFFPKIIDTTLPLLKEFHDCNQSDVWNSDSLNEGYQIGPFTKYQLSSDLLYIDRLNIKPDIIDYNRLGTQRGMHEITGHWDYDNDVIMTIMDINNNYDHKTEYTKHMIPSDANNVLCEFYKYTVSNKVRRRKPEIITHKKNDVIIPKAIKEFNHNDL